MPATRFRFILPALLIALASVGCDRPPCQACAEAVGDSGPRLALWTNGECRFDRTGDKADPVFFVLGFLADPLGRHIVEGSDRVESLGRSEEGEAAILRRALSAIAHGQHFDSKIVEEQDDVNLQFRSPQIAALIDSCFSYRQGSDGWVQDPDGTIRRMTDAVLSSSLFIRAGRYDADVGLSFIRGAYARFGEHGAFRFPGRPVKAQIIAELLANLHCRDVRIESTVGLIPGATRVIFEPTPEVRAALAAPTVW